MEPLRKRLGVASRRVLIVTVVAVGSVAATARAKGSADRMLEGTRIDGVNVSGMTRHQAMEAVLRGVTPKLRSQVTLVADKRRFTVTPAQLGGEAEASQTVDRALAGRGLSWVAKLWYRVSGQSTNREIQMRYNYNHARVASFVDSVAGKVDRSVQDAGIKLTNGRLTVQHARSGWSLD